MRADPLAEVLGRAADHQAGDEDREDREDEDPVEAGADAARRDLAEHHVHERDSAAERGEAVVRAVDRAGRGAGGRGGEDARDRRSEAGLLALQVRARRPRAPRPAGCPATRRCRRARRLPPRGSPSRRARPSPAACPSPGVRRRTRARTGSASSAKISSRFVNGVGFESGCAEFALSVPPPFVPSSLIASWLANGPPGIDWVAPSSVRASVNPSKLWIAPRATSTSASTIASGRRIRVTARVRSTQKLPIVSLRRRVMPADERDRDRDPDRRRDEVLDGEPAHLREVAHRRLAAVVLPVRVGDEADGGVERERRRDAGDVGRVEEERALDALEQVEAEHRDGAEREHRARVAGPPLLARRDRRRGRGRSRARRVRRRGPRGRGSPP